ncbi:MAG TPA: hypothetical protein VFV11_00945 [Solimonas sp.]|nr:hypothetical protein [Solimonas sp.]
MPRKPKKQPPPNDAAKSYDEFADESEAGDEDAATADTATRLANSRLRDWRDVEKLKEERALRRLIDDDLDFDGPRLRRR